jgi:hypothetical protein
MYRFWELIRQSVIFNHDDEALSPHVMRRVGVGHRDHLARLGDVPVAIRSHPLPLPHMLRNGLWAIGGVDSFERATHQDVGIRWALQKIPLSFRGI